MKTSKPFATISFNTFDFLKRKVDELVLAHHIEFACWVEHYAEEDERKNHIHLFMIPNGQCDTDSIRRFLQEIDPLHPNKPLGCLPMLKSKFDDWFLYSCHDKSYLASKGQSRKFQYSFDDFATTDEDFFIEAYHTIDRSKFSGAARLLGAIENGMSFAECVSLGMVPMQQYVGYEKAYNLLSYHHTARNGRYTHTPATDMVIDAETGEAVFAPEEAMAFEVALHNAKANKG